MQRTRQLDRHQHKSSAKTMRIILKHSPFVASFDSFTMWFIQYASGSGLLMEFGFLATVAFILLSWRHLIFGNIIDLTGQTLLEESWAGQWHHYFLHSWLIDELNSVHNWWTLHSYWTDLSWTINLFFRAAQQHSTEFCLHLWIIIFLFNTLKLLWNNLYFIKHYINKSELTNKFSCSVYMANMTVVFIENTTMNCKTKQPNSLNKLISFRYYWNK